MKNKFSNRTINIPDNDCDITLKFKNGKEITIQCRPSNADVGYEGSLDIILPENQSVICWEGDNLEPAKASHENCPNERIAKQLCIEMPTK